MIMSFTVSCSHLTPNDKRAAAGLGRPQSSHDATQVQLARQTFLSQAIAGNIMCLLVCTTALLHLSDSPVSCPPPAALYLPRKHQARGI